MPPMGGPRGFSFPPGVDVSRRLRCHAQQFFDDPIQRGMPVIGFDNRRKLLACIRVMYAHRLRAERLISPDSRSSFLNVAVDSNGSFFGPSRSYIFDSFH